MEKTPNPRATSEILAFWDEKTADAIRAAVYAERQREIAEIALSGQLQIDYPEN